MADRFTLEYQLQQHTPIIHFQHNQHGATLRATELKPKLDKFITQKMRAEGEEVPESWWINRGNNNQRGNLNYQPLNYKIRIIDKSKKNEKGDTVIIPPDSKQHIISNEIVIQFFTLKPLLKEYLEMYMEEFFVLHNFGLRQNKGWGGFTLVETNNFENILKQSGKHIYKRRQKSKLNGFYQDIIADWHIIKSGENQKGRNRKYIKSYLFKYMCSQGIRWEKRYIKQRLNQQIQNQRLPASLLGENSPVDCVNGEDGCVDNTEEYFSWENNPEFAYDFRFVRALLGLPEHHEYRAEENHIYHVMFQAKGAVERFKAPVTFKYFNGNIYAILEEIPMDILRQASFKVLVQVKRNKRPLGNPFTLIDDLKLPDKFSAVEFFDTYFPCIDYKKINLT